jgi:hypothetical protein
MFNVLVNIEHLINKKARPAELGGWVAGQVSIRRDAGLREESPARSLSCLQSGFSRPRSVTFATIPDLLD